MLRATTRTSVCAVLTPDGVSRGFYAMQVEVDLERTFPEHPYFRIDTPKNGRGVACFNSLQY
eukprot:COSAG01_NODE_68605_length_263_cov_1.500000_1_plen_61_part_10